MDETDEFGEWDLTPLSIPPRSTLYALRPIGMRTPLVESLTSYITRLAEAHSVFSGSLLYKLIVPLVPGYTPSAKQHALFRESGHRSTLLNGTGHPAQYAVSALETLTLRSDLSFLTLLPLGAILPARAKGLMRLTKAWCPLCYEEWRRSRQPVYDPLLWFLQEVTFCCRHQFPLNTRCPYQDCARVLPAVGWRARAGYCSYCQRWLGGVFTGTSVEHSSLEEKTWFWQQWITQTVGEVLAFLPERPIFPKHNRIQQVIVYAVQHLAAGNFSAFTRALGIQLATVHQWHQGKALPELPMLLQLCCRLGLSLHQVLFQEVETLPLQFSTSPLLEPLTPKETVAADEVTIYQTLEGALADNKQPPPTLRKIARQLGRAEQTLYNIHPVACHAIVARYKAYVQQQKETRLQKFYAEIKHIAVQLHANGEVPTQKRISSHLSQPGIFRDPRVCAFVEEIRRELEEIT
jgi:DNA-binding XRE family transcriptional regulator